MLKQSKVAHLNKDVFNQPPKKSKVRRLIPVTQCEEVVWMHQRLSEFCAEKKLHLHTELRFHSERQWQFDFAVTDNHDHKTSKLKIAVEFEGGIWMKGGGAHSRPQNIERDIEKYNAAQSDGWKVMRFHGKTYKTVLHEIERIIEKCKS